MAKFGFTRLHLSAPTPKKMKRIGNALISVSTTVGTPTALAGYVWIGIAIAAAGVIGKIITAFYAEDDAVSTTTK